MKLTAWILLALALTGSLTLYLLRTRPVLFAYKEAGDPRKEPSWSIFNPFRDRAPERAAEELLQGLSRGYLKAAFAATAMSTPDRQHASEEEALRPLVKWQLVGRIDDSSQVRLTFRTARAGSSGLDAPVWMTLKRKRAQWQVVAFEAWY
jgi:hypothetical protein